MLGEQCCTFVPNHTAPDGKLTRAIEGLRTKKIKEDFGVEKWDGWLNRFGRLQGLVASVLMSIALLTALLTVSGCCCIPCIRARHQTDQHYLG